MSESRHVLTFDRVKTQYTDPCVLSIHSALQVSRTRIKNVSRNMNSEESTPQHLLLQNVKDLRKRLMETEHTLKKLDKSNDGMSGTSEDFRREIDLRMEMEDDRESLQSGLATLPDSSYAGFVRRQPPSSTPSRPTKVRSRLIEIRNTEDEEDDQSDYGSKRRITHNPPVRDEQLETEYLRGEVDSIRRAHFPDREPRVVRQSFDNVGEDDFEQEDDDRQERSSQRSSHKLQERDLEEDKQDWRHQAKFLKEANKKILIQNQKLMTEMEKTSFELQASRAKVRELSYEMDEYRRAVPDLEDKLMGLQAETESQDKTLRDAEERYETCQRECVLMDRKHKEGQQEIEELRSERNEERKLRKSLETQRDKALQNFLETQDSLEEYQKKMKERLKKSEGSEDHLRDNLSHANREREELIERLSWFQTKVKSQQEEIRRLQAIEEVDEETRTDMEEHNKELRTELSKLSAKISRLEGDSSLLESLQMENSHLKSQVSSQHEQLAVCQQEIEESRTMLTQLEQLAHQVQHNSRNSSSNGSLLNDSGNFSIRQGTETSGATFYKSLDGSHSKAMSGAGAKSILTDLRMKLAMKDAEIQRLQASLQSSLANDQSSVIENLRADLNHMLERNQQCAEQAQELESSRSRVEAERMSLRQELTNLKQQLSDQNSLTNNMEVRVTQRNEQLIELQEQINDRSMEVSRLEKELRQRSSQTSTLEQDLEEKTTQCTIQSEKMKNLKGEVSAREDEAQTLHKELREKKLMESKVRDEQERVQHIHHEQCQDYQRQIEILQDRVDNKTGQASEWEKQTERLRQEFSNTSSLLQQTTLKLTQTQEELEHKSTQSEEMLEQLESQAAEGASHIKQLEQALELCRDELQTYIHAMEESKDVYDRHLMEKEKKIKHLNRQLKVTQHNLELKSQDSCDLEKTVMERQTMLQQGSARITELEEVQSQLQQQVSRLEHQLLKGNATWLSDSESLERQRQEACQDLEERTAQMLHVQDSLKITQSERKQLSMELELIRSQLEDEQTDNDRKSNRVNKLEKDVRDLRVQLEQKMEIVVECDEQLKAKNRDMDQQLDLVKDMDVEIKRLQDAHQEALDQGSQLEKSLDKVQYEGKAKDEMIEDMKESLVRAQDELVARKQEGADLKEKLEVRQSELTERVSQVTQLDDTIKQHQKEMEQRIQKLDANVRHNEAEVFSRTQQIVELDDKLQQTQAELREKTLLLQQKENLTQHQQMELQSKSAKLQELQTTVERQRVKLDEEKDENVEITQELRLTREQLQQQHADFMSTRRELSQSSRDQERVQRELEELHAMLKTKEEDAARLAEELGSTKAREKEKETRISDEVRRMSDDLEDINVKHKNELDRLKEELSDYVEATEILKAQLKEKNKQQSDMEEHYNNQVNLAAQELDNIHGNVESQREVIQVTNEQVILKDAEIARLTAKISGLERTISAMKLSDSFNASLSSAAHHRSSTVGSIPLHGHGNKNGHLDKNKSNSQSVHMTTELNSDNQIEVEQEIQIIDNSGHTKNGEKTKGRKSDTHTRDDQENIEPTGPIRVLNFSECDNNVYNTAVIHRPKPVLPNNQKQKDSLQVLHGGSSSTESVLQSTQQQKHGQSAFSRISSKDKKPLQEKVLPGEVEMEPLTAVNMYGTGPEADESAEIDPEQCMKELQERLRANERRQQDIDRQLESLEFDDDELITNR